MATKSPSSTLARSTDQTTNHSLDPPLLSITIPKLKDLQVPSKSWELAERPTDVLLLTVEDQEFLACYFYLDNAYRSYTKGLGRVYFGEIVDGLDKVKISLIRCNRGSIKAGASHIVVRNAVDCLQPKVVFSVGVCGGLGRGKAKLGDVVISGKLSTYADKQIINDREQWCGNTVNVSKNIGDLIKYAADGWKAPLNDPEALEIQVHRDAEIITGPELVNSPEKSEELLKMFPGATAIELEGQGLFATAFDCQLEWVIIKGISHFADGSECGTKAWKSFASVMAASIVQNILKEPDILDNWPHYKESLTCDSKKEETGILTSATVPDGKPRTGGTALTSEHHDRQESPIRLQMHEIAQIAQRIAHKWKEIALLTTLFEGYEVENISCSRVGEDETSKALTMLTRYTEKSGSRNVLANALNKAKLQPLSQKVLSGYFVDGN